MAQYQDRHGDQKGDHTTHIMHNFFFTWEAITCGRFASSIRWSDFLNYAPATKAKELDNTQSAEKTFSVTSPNVEFDPSS